MFKFRVSTSISTNIRYIRFFLSTNRFPRKGKPTNEFYIDRSELGKAQDDLPDLSNIQAPQKELLTDLGEDLKSYIQMRGPITVNEYMSLALTHGLYGYYQQDFEKIGEDGNCCFTIFNISIGTVVHS
jgi:hypothetical protein